MKTITSLSFIICMLTSTITLPCEQPPKALTHYEIQQQLFNAISFGQIEAVQNSIALGADVNKKNDIGRAALTMATFCGKAAIAQALLIAGANVQEADEYGQTPLMHASSLGWTELVTLLLDSGANIHTKCYSGRDAVDIAHIYKRTHIVNLLHSYQPLK